MTDHSTKHWSRRIPEYLAAGWSSGPTPFAKLAGSYFSKPGRILELGAGGGMDSLWFASQGFEVVMTDGTDVGFEAIRSRAKSEQLDLTIQKLDLIQPFQLDSNSFDAVYAQLVLHYFDDATTQAIIAEIWRVLKPGGVFACMVNSTKDPEYDAAAVDGNGLIRVGDLMKRYFSKDSFGTFVKDFETLLIDENGRTPKDDDVSNSGMIQFIGRKV